MFNQEELEEEFELNEDDLPDEDTDKDPDPVDPPADPEPKDSGPKFISKEDWIAQGRDADMWVSPEVFKERTQRINETSRLKQENARLRAEREEDNRKLNNVVFLQQAELTRLRADTERKRDDAIEIGDKSAVKAFDKQLKDIDAQEDLIKEPEKTQQTPAIPKEVEEWNAENDWLTEDHPLKPLANQVFVKALEEGSTIAKALRLVDKELAKRRADEPQKKVPTKSIVDSPSRGTVARSDSVTLRMSDCTREERDMYTEFYKPSGVSEKEFLKTVAEARKGN